LGNAGGSVLLEGQEVTVRAGVHVMSSYSAHADQQGLLEWVASMEGRPQIKLVHGEAQAQRVLVEKLVERGYRVG
jgi:metallo-beta-lactamase family protein